MMSEPYERLDQLVNLKRENATLRDAVRLGISMRRLQAAYFKNGTQEALVFAKQAEADFDAASRAIWGEDRE